MNILLYKLSTASFIDDGLGQVRQYTTDIIGQTVFIFLIFLIINKIYIFG